MDFSCFLFLVLNQSAVLTSHSADSEISKAPEPPKPKKNRCFMCRKKVGLTGNGEPLKLMWLLLNIAELFTRWYFNDLVLFCICTNILTFFFSILLLLMVKIMISGHQKHLFWSSDVVPNVLRNQSACYQEDDVLYCSYLHEHHKETPFRYDPASPRFCNLKTIIYERSHSCNK